MQIGPRLYRVLIAAALAAVGLLAAASTARADLVHHWTFDEGAGAFAADSIGGLTYRGTLQNGPAWSASHPAQTGAGGSLTFDGGNDYVSFAQFSFADTSDFSVSLWYKGTDDGSTIVYNRPLVGHSASSLGANLTLQGGKITYAHYDGSWLGIQSTSQVTDDAWHHAVIVNHSTRTMDIWIDGVREVTGAASGMSGGQPPFKIDSFMGSTVYGGYVAGSLDDVRVFDHALGSAEVAAMFGGAVPEPATAALLALGAAALLRGAPRRRAWLARALALLAGIVLAAPGAAAATIYSEDFEAYAASTNLIGQGGWTGTASGGPEIRVGAGGTLGTTFVNGRVDTGSGVHFAQHALAGPFSTSLVYTLSFRAYAYSTGIATRNAGIYFGQNTTTLLAGWATLGAAGDWTFDARTITGDSGASQAFAGGIDKIVGLRVVLDGGASRIYGQYDYGSGFQDTAAYTLTAGQYATALAGVNRVILHQDFDSLGADFDDVLVASEVAVPEPASCALLALGAGALVSASRRRARRARGRPARSGS